MEHNDGIGRRDVAVARRLFEESKELVRSDNAIARYQGIIILCALRDLLLNIDAEFFEYVLDYE